MYRFKSTYISAPTSVALSQRNHLAIVCRFIALACFMTLLLPRLSGAQDNGNTNNLCGGFNFSTPDGCDNHFAPSSDVDVQFKLSPNSSLDLSSSLSGIDATGSTYNYDNEALTSPSADGAHFRIPDAYFGSEDDYRLDMSARYNVDITDKVKLSPYGKMSITEGLAADSTLINRRVQGMHSQTSESAIGLGANISMDMQQDWGTVSPFASLNAEQKQAYNRTGDVIDESKRFNLGVGFQAEFSKRAKAFMSYENSVSTELDNSDQQISAGFQFDY